MSERKAKVVIEGEDRFSRTFAAFDRTVKGSERVIGGLESRIGGLGLTLGSLGAGLSVSAILTAVKNTADGFDRLNDAADVTGERIEVLSALEDLARRNGGSLAQVEDALIKINKALGETDPDSEVGRALAAIGLSAAELRRLSPAEALRAVALGLAKVDGDGEKSRITMALFGKSIKEAAPFLNDLAEAGELNGSVTEEQAKQAERFNKNLAELQTSVSNAARGLVGELIPAVNKVFDAVKQGNVAKLFHLDELESRATQLSTVYQATWLGIERMMKSAALKLDPGNESLARELEDIDAKARQLAGTFNQARSAMLAAQAVPAPGSEPPKLRLGDGDSGGKSTKASEAARYLEQLDRQLEKTYDLSTAEQAVLDIQQGRIAGITPKLQEEILAKARLVDLSKQALDARTSEIEVSTRAARAALDNLDALTKQNDELDAEVRRIGLTEAAITDLELARINDAIATKQQAIAKQEAAGVDERQLQVLYAEIDALSRRKELLIEKVGRSATEEARRADIDQAGRDLKKPVDEFTLQAQRSIQSGLAGTISAVLSGDFNKVGALFQRLLVDMAAQAAAARIGRDLFGDFLSGGELGGGFGSILKSVIGFFGLPGFASGGDHSGGLRIVGERGPELEATGPARYWSASETGQLLNKAGSGGGRSATSPQPVIINQNFTINGDVSPQTIAAIKAAQAQNNQMLLRSMRTGGAYAA